MNIHSEDLKNVLRKFDENGGTNIAGEHWAIIRGGYDLQWQLYYDSEPVIDCIASTGTQGKISKNNAQSIPTDRYKEVVSAIEQVYGSDFIIEGEGFPNTTGMTFNLYVDLTNIPNSMLLESGTKIAEITKGDDVIVALGVRGAVEVNYKDSTFYSANKFPENLKELIRTDPDWFENPDVYVKDNNWFEVFITGERSLLSISVGFANASPELIYETLADVANELYGREVLPLEYKKYINDGGLINNETNLTVSKNNDVLNHETKLFGEMLNDMGLELALTKEMADNGADYDYFVRCYFESRNNEWTLENPTYKKIQELKSDHESFSDFLSDNPLILRDKMYDECMLIGAFSAEDILEYLDTYTCDFLVRDLVKELHSYGINTSIDESESFNVFVTLGENLKNGTDKEQEFYKNHQENFEQIALVANGCRNVNLEQIAALSDLPKTIAEHNPVKDKPKTKGTKDVERE